VHKGHVEKGELRCVQFAVPALFDRRFSHLARLRFGGEALRFAAEHVEGKLIQHDDQRQCAFGGAVPVFKLAVCRCAPSGEETLAQLSIKSRG
jgi:hypothetical protein